MVAVLPVVDEQVLREQVWRSLRLNLIGNAIFLAERLFAENAEEENAYILAVAYHRQGKPVRAKEALRGRKGEQCRYLLAQCCVELGELTEAESELAGGAGVSYDSGEYQNRVPNGAAGFYLLGRVCRLTGRSKQAVKHLRTALELNPLLWSAYEELCQLGAEDDVRGVVSDHGDRLAAGSSGDQGNGGFSFLPPSSASAAEEQNKRKIHNEAEGAYVTPPQVGHAGSGHLLLPTPSHAEGGGLALPFVTPGEEPAPAAEGAAAASPSPGSFVTPPVTATSDDYVTPEAPEPGPKVLPQSKGRRINYEGKMRKVSGRLFGDPMDLSPPSRSVHVGTSTPVLGGKHKPRVLAWMEGSHDQAESNPGPAARTPKPFQAAREPEPAPSPAVAMAAAKRGGAAGAKVAPASGHRAYASTVDLLGRLALGFAANCKFKSEEALEIFASLPRSQSRTAWVQCQVAKANFELVRYEAAATHFKEARRLDRFRLEDLEIYSTVLWHMKRETELMYLAHELMAVDRLSPQSWCVLGNCFSLQKEHETALQFFQRALQLDPRFTYAHTLCGHEYFANEDFASSLRCYRNAIRIDPQHYNAWYGIGQIYFKQEKFEMTEYHYRRALEINRNSSVLRCCLGKTLHKMGCTDEALELLDEAVSKDPNNAIAKYERAVVLFSIGHLLEALRELETLKDIAPREPNLFFLLGKTCKRLGRIDQAMAHFCVALDLKPSSADIGVIKSAIEKLKLPEDEEDSL